MAVRYWVAHTGQIIAPDGSVVRVKPWKVKSGEKRYIPAKIRRYEHFRRSPEQSPMRAVAHLLYPHPGQIRYPGRLAMFADWLGISRTTCQQALYGRDQAGQMRISPALARLTASRLTDHANTALDLARQLRAYADRREATTHPTGAHKTIRRNSLLRRTLTG